MEHGHYARSKRVSKADLHPFDEIGPIDRAMAHDASSEKRRNVVCKFEDLPEVRIAYDQKRGVEQEEKPELWSTDVEVSEEKLT